MNALAFACYKSHLQQKRKFNEIYCNERIFCVRQNYKMGDFNTFKPRKYCPVFIVIPVLIAPFCYKTDTPFFVSTFHKFRIELPPFVCYARDSTFIALIIKISYRRQNILQQKGV